MKGGMEGNKEEGKGREGKEAWEGNRETNRSANSLQCCMKCFGLPGVFRAMRNRLAKNWTRFCS